MIESLLPLLIEPLYGEMSYQQRLAITTLSVIVMGWMTTYVWPFLGWVWNKFVTWWCEEKLPAERFHMTIENNKTKGSDMSGNNKYLINAVFNRLCKEDLLNKSSTALYAPVHRMHIDDHGYYMSHSLVLDFEEGIKGQIADDMWFETSCIKGDNTEKQIIVISSSTSINRCKEFIEESYQMWVDETYPKPNEPEDDKFYMSIRSKSHNGDSSRITWNMARFTTKMSFDSIFFKDKDLVISMVDKFLAGNRYNKLGFLLYGIPGCGKTSFIKCLANHTSRHIFDISLNRITTNAELRDIFFLEQFTCYSGSRHGSNTKCIPLNERIIVMEDIDVLSKVVKRRKKKETKWTDESSLVDSISENGYMESIDELSDDVKSPKLKYDGYGSGGDTTPSYGDCLNLSGMLNIFDGIMEMDGPIIIMTTNCPEDLDPALIRHGRVNRRIYFGKLGRKEFRDMVKYHYPEAEDDPMFDVIVEKNIDRWTPNDLEVELDQLETWDKVKLSLNHNMVTSDTD